MTTLLFVSDIPWHSLYQRPQHLASRLARTHHVLWIEPATLAGKVYFRPHHVQQGVHILSLPLFPHNARQKFIQQATHILSQRASLRWGVLQWQLFLVKRAMRNLELNGTELLCVIQNFQLINLVERLQPKRVLFDYIDDAFGFVTFPSYVRDDWKKTIERADAITATTEELAKLIRAERQTNIHVINNGVDYEFFTSSAQNQRPVDLPSIEKPIIGYVGSVAAWFDFDLVEYCLQHFPNVNFVIIGREHPVVADRVAALKKHHNFFFLGYKPYAELPPFVQCFDAGIIPFLKNQLTAAVNPVKLYEYCAAGIPTVSTDFSDDLLQFEKVIMLARSSNQFLQKLGLALAKSQDEQYKAGLREFARMNDWNARAEQMTRLLQSTLNSQSEK